MKRYARYFFKADDPDVLERLPPRFQSIDVYKKEKTKHERDDAPKYRYTWIFYEDDWFLWSTFCEWIKGQDAVLQYADLVIDPDDLSNDLSNSLIKEKAHVILSFNAQIWWDVETLNADIWEKSVCDICSEHRVTKIKKNPVLKIRLPNVGSRPHIFVGDEDTTLMSVELYNGLKSAGLTSGLETYPVEVENDRDDTYVGVYATVDLGAPAAPFGYREPCSGCGGYFPLQSFYRVYHRPEKEMHWMTSLPYASDFIISADVYNWLESEGAELSDRRPPGYNETSAWKFYAISGWYPDEADLAFFPEKFHAK